MGRRRRGVALTLVAICWLAGTGTATAGWSRPVRMTKTTAVAHDARAIWTRDGRVVALVNRNVPSGLLAYRSPGAGAFTSTGLIAPDQAPAYAIAPLAGGGAVALYLSEDALLVRTAGSDGRFGPPERVADRHDVAFPHLIVGARGDVLVVWTVPLCQTGCGPVNTVQAAFRPAGASTFEPTRQLSAPGEPAAGPRGVIDAQGNALVTWLTGPADENSLEGARLNYALRPAGGQFGPGGRIAPETGVAGYRLAGAGGRVAVVWSRDDRHPIRVATGSVTGGFGRVRTLGGTRGRTARVALRGGSGMVGWTEELSGHQRLLRVALLGPDGPGRPRTLRRAKIRALEVKVGSDGRRLVTWQERRNYRRSLRAALARSSGPFRSQTLDARDTLGYKAAATARGALLVTWSVSPGHHQAVLAAAAHPGHGFGHPARLGGSRRDDALGATLSTAPDGRALAVWVASAIRSGNSWIVARYWRP
jgi:hypothetical protein